MKKLEKQALLLMLIGIFLISAPLPSSYAGFFNLLAFVLFLAGAVLFYRS